VIPRRRMRPQHRQASQMDAPLAERIEHGRQAAGETGDADPPAPALAIARLLRARSIQAAGVVGS